MGEGSPDEEVQEVHAVSSQDGQVGGFDSAAGDDFFGGAADSPFEGVELISDSLQSIADLDPNEDSSIATDLASHETVREQATAPAVAASAISEGYSQAPDDPFFAWVLPVAMLANPPPESAPLRQADPVMWIAGNGEWTNPDNWSTGQVPAAGDDVLIDVADQDIVVDITGDVQVKDLQSQESLRLVTGSLTLNGTVVVAGSLTALSGTSVTADGPDASLMVSGMTLIDGANLFASNGGEIVLPQALVYDHSSTGNDQTRFIRATGPGSVIDLRNLGSMTNGAHFN